MYTDSHRLIFQKKQGKKSTTKTTTRIEVEKMIQRG